MSDDWSSKDVSEKPTVLLQRIAMIKKALSKRSKQRDILHDGIEAAFRWQNQERYMTSFS